MSVKRHLCEVLTYFLLQSIGVTNRNCYIRVMLEMSLGKILGLVFFLIMKGPSQQQKLPKNVSFTGGITSSLQLINSDFPFLLSY